MKLLCPLSGASAANAESEVGLGTSLNFLLCMSTSVCTTCDAQRTICRSHFSSTMWVPGTELGFHI